MNLLVFGEELLGSGFGLGFRAWVCDLASTIWLSK